MRALSVREPWATAIIHFGKNVENRTWKPPPARFGQRIGIHASLGVDLAMVVDLAGTSRVGSARFGPDGGFTHRWEGIDGEVEGPDGKVVATARGHLIGSVVLLDVHQPGSLLFSSPWAHADSPWHWQVERPVADDPTVPMKGSLSLWPIPQDPTD